MNISLSDGKPGRTADFNVRGAGSINGGSALVLIDGVEGDPSMLNPNDIESISVWRTGSIWRGVDHDEERYGRQAEGDMVF